MTHFNTSQTKKHIFRTNSFSILFFILFIITQFNWEDAKAEDFKNVGISRVAKILFIKPNTNNATPEELNDVVSIRNSLFVSGLNITETSSDKVTSIKISNFDLIIVPNASAKELTDKAIECIEKAVSFGASLFFDGTSKLNNHFKIQLLPATIRVTKIRDLQFHDNLLYWSIPGNVQPIDNHENKFSPLCIIDSSKLVIAIQGQIGKGKFIYYSPLFDPNTNKGYSRFPYLIETFSRVFGIMQLAECRASEMFYDAGMKIDSLSYNQMAEQWRKNKIKRIYASGWYLKDSTEYDELIHACHSNGIVVCCWLETPMISIEFWNKHPEWREKTAYLKDAQIDWRYLMNLADSNCRKEVFKEFEALLMNHDWDGVNLAELYFEPSPVGPEYAQNFTPMNDIVRQEFNKLAGFDPYFLFDTNSPHYWRTNSSDWRKFADYRKNLCLRLKTNFLDYLSTVRNRKKDFELMLTVIDVSLTPELSDNIGENTQNALDLYAKYHLSLQSEDPSNCWGSTPDRYDKMGRFYRTYVKNKNELIFDCNVVSSHEKGYGGFPSEKPTGEEIRQITYNMMLSDSRPTFYSEDAIFFNDFKNISTVLGRETKITEISKNYWLIVTPKTVIVNIGKIYNKIELDGKQWLATDGSEIIIPAGEHKLKFSNESISISYKHLLLISGELMKASFMPNVMVVDYEEDIAPCYVTLDKRPTSVTIDSNPFVPEVFSDCLNRYTIKLPRGKHGAKLFF